MGLENPLHIAILLVILLLLFGAKRLPEMGRGLGSGIRSFKDGISGRGDDESEPAGPAATAAPALPAAAAPVAATPDTAPPATAAEPSDATAGADAEPVGNSV